MNNIRQIQELNRRELESGVSQAASWHADYRDTAYIYIGGLPYELSEGDILTIFSQFGEPSFVNLVRDKETGKSKGFAFLKYDDQRSTDLAVDNLGGATIMNRVIKVDHTRYKKKDDEDADGYDRSRPASFTGIIKNDESSADRAVASIDHDIENPLLKEELELAALIRNHDDDDPMKMFLIQEKKEQISAALATLKNSTPSGAERKSKGHHRQQHQHRRSHRSGDIDEREDDKRRSRRYESVRRRRRSGSRV